MSWLTAALLSTALAAPAPSASVHPEQTRGAQLLRTWGRYDLFVPATVASLTYSPDGKELLARETGAALRSWDLGSGQLQGHWPAASLCLREGGGFGGGRACGHPACHLDAVSALAADGQHLVSSTDRALEICNLHGQKEPQPVPLPAGSSTPTAVALSPDRHTVYLGDEAGAVHVLPSDGAQGGYSLALHTRRVVALRADADGRTLWSLGDDGRVVRATPNGANSGPRSPASGFTVARASKHEGDCSAESVQAGAFSADGSLVAVATRKGGADLSCAGGEGALRVYDLKKQALRWELPGAVVRAVAFSPSGKELALAAAVHPEDRGEPRPIRIVRVDAQTGKLLEPASREAITSVHFSPDGARAVVGDAGGNAQLFDVATGQRLAAASFGGGAVDGLAFSPDGMAVVVQTADDRSQVLPVPAFSPAKTLVAPPRNTDPGHRADGTRCLEDEQAKRALAAMRGDDAPVRTPVAAKGKLAPLVLRDPQTFSLESRSPEEVAFVGAHEVVLPYADEQCAAYGNDCGSCERTYSLVRVSAVSGRATRRYDDVDDELLGGCSVRPDIFLTRHERGGVDVHGADGHVLTRFASRFGEVKACAASRSGERILLSTPGTLALYDGRNFRLLTALGRGAGAWGPVALSPDGSLALQLSRTQVHLLKLPSGEEVARLPLELSDDAPSAVDFAPDGQSFAVGTARGVVLHFGLGGANRLPAPP